MKRLFQATLPALTLCFTLLFSACSPSGSMIATLTQLPFAATPPTFTPYPTATRHARTSTPVPPGFEANNASLTGTPASSPTIVPSETITVRVSCSPGTFDTTVPSPDTPEQFIGKHYDQGSPPNEIKWLANGSLGTNDRSWAHVRVLDREMYLIQKIACRDANGLPYWEIADALTLPMMDIQAHEVAVDLCFNGSRRLANVIAYGSYDPSQPAAPVVSGLVGWPVQVKSAWEMKDRFIPIGAQGLTCLFQESQK
jgi:hypothetical protein